MWQCPKQFGVTEVIEVRVAFAAQALGDALGVTEVIKVRVAFTAPTHAVTLRVNEVIKVTVSSTVLAMSKALWSN